MTLPDNFDLPDDVGIPSVDVCAFCGDVYCDGIGCIAELDPDDVADQPTIEQLHDLIRAGAAWKIAQTHGFVVAERVLAHAENRAVPCTPAPLCRCHGERMVATKAQRRPDLGVSWDDPLYWLCPTLACTETPEVEA